MKQINSTIYPSIAQSFGITGIAVLSIIIMGIISPFLNTFFGVEGGQLVFTILAMGIPLWIVSVIKKKQTGSATFDLSVKNIGVLPYLIIMSAALLIGIIMPIGSLIPIPEVLKESFATLAGQTGIFTFILMVIAAPVLEELLFRGIILDGLLKRYSPVKSILISALLFGIVHLNPWQFVTGFTMGILIGWVYSKNKCVLTSIIMHASVNLTAYVLRIFLDREQHLSGTLTEIYGGATNLTLIIAASIVVISIGVFILNKAFNKEDLDINKRDGIISNA
ncbi:type II CAAX endopeptidase family protein [Fulvivirgaceae bacterium BMA10]|uniref:Type II CAAX endopeptidase family protein n=1 Tax=Splendidivirga corallicola TaxID=3051826 RepID=A0ABT8KTT3_9BACT|nr:type II CAAX endopeptidase family protein [Fulvivirgaceae bacterium BMA10]